MQHVCTMSCSIILFRSGDCEGRAKKLKYILISLGTGGGTKRSTVCSTSTKGKNDIPLSDLKNYPNYNLIYIFNDEQSNNFIGDNASDFDDSPYHNLNFNCNYYDEQSKNE